MTITWMEYQAMVERQLREAYDNMVDAEKKYKEMTARYETVLKQSMGLEDLRNETK